MRAPSSPRQTARMPLLALVLYAALAGGYFVLRFGGRWIGSDTANLTVATAAVARQATLEPQQGIYGLGFAYQAVLVFITSVTGLSLSQLQLLVYPVVSAGLSLVAFAMYRVLSGDDAVAALATFFLFLQPDFLFVIFRGSHEKVTWLATMLAVFLLAKSFGAVDKLSHLVAYVGLFYLAVLACIASNAFFGSSFILAVIVSLAAGAAIERFWRSGGVREAASRMVVRLAYVVASAVVVWYLNTFYLYQPAAVSLLELENAVDRAAAVTLGRQPTFDPYATISGGWVSQAAYLGLILPSWIAGVVSFVLWIVVGVRMVRGQGVHREPSQFLLWLLYGGFGAQLALGVVLDLLKAIGGNLQQRFFPVVMLFAFPLVAQAIVGWWRDQRAAPRRHRLALGLSLLILWASGASLLKSTNDPWLSNYWRFWTVPEDRAVQWVGDHLRYRGVWLGLDGIRVASHAVAGGFRHELSNEVDTWALNLETRDVLLSSMDQGLSVRRSIPLPDVRGEHRVYDNGTVVHYHFRPRTPYQR